MLDVLEPDLSLMTPLPFCSELAKLLLTPGAADVLLLAIIDAAMIAAALCSTPRGLSTLVEKSLFLTRVRTTRFLLPLAGSRLPYPWLKTYCY